MKTETQNYTLRMFDDPALKAKCAPLHSVEDTCFVEVMKRICHDNRGVGLAAPQIGVLKQAIVVMPSGRGRNFTMFNPVIEHRGPEVLTAEEGCLSYPGVRVPIERHYYISVAYFDWQWKYRTDSYVGWEARIIQHEIDHLNGICRVGDAWRATP